MKLFNKIKNFLSLTPEEIVATDRRAFLMGMSVTAAGLLVAKPTFFLPTVRGSIETDFLVANGDIRYVGNGQKYAVLDLHRHLSSLADEACFKNWGSSGGSLDITSDIASYRSHDRLITITSGYNIDDDSVSMLYGGTILQESPSGKAPKLKFDRLNRSPAKILRSMDDVYKI